MPQTGGRKTYTINPAAVMKSLQERYNYLIGTRAGSLAFQDLYNTVQDYVRTWSTELSNDPRGDHYGSDNVTFSNFIRSADAFSKTVNGAVGNAKLVEYAQKRDRFLGVSTSASQDAIRKELRTRVYEQGMSLQDAVKTMIDAGFDIGEVQAIASKVGDPQYDPEAAAAANKAAGSAALGAGGGGSSGYRRYKQVPTDFTNPQTEFERGYSAFSRSLEKSGAAGGTAPNLAALDTRYKDLYQKYLGDIQNRIKTGEEPANVWKEAFVNLGKNTDPQYDTTSDVLQQVTVRPKLSVEDWLAQNVDPEDVYASTPFNDRVGRSTGGFRGFVRRISR